MKIRNILHPDYNTEPSEAEFFNKEGKKVKKPKGFDKKRKNFLKRLFKEGKI